MAVDENGAPFGESARRQSRMSRRVHVPSEANEGYDSWSYLLQCVRQSTYSPLLHDSAVMGFGDYYSCGHGSDSVELHEDLVMARDVSGDVRRRRGSRRNQARVVEQRNDSGRINDDLVKEDKSKRNVEYSTILKHTERLIKYDLFPLFEGWFENYFRNYMRKVIIPKFWSYFEKTEEETLKSTPSEAYLYIENRFANACLEIFASLQPFSPYLDALKSVHGVKDGHTFQRKVDGHSGFEDPSVSGSDSLSQFGSYKEVINSCFVDSTPKEFSQILQYFFLGSYQCFLCAHKPRKTDSDEELESSDCDESGSEEVTLSGTKICVWDKDSDQLKRRLAVFDRVCKTFCSLGLMHSIGEPIFASVIQQEITSHIRSQCKDNFETSLLEPSLEWLNSCVLNWLSTLLNCSPDSSVYVQWKARLEFYTFKTIADCRIEQMFDIIIDFPDSEPALADLKKCLENIDHKDHLTNSLRNAFIKRLLHPGANTVDIITQYISAIKSLRIVDPEAIVLNVVCEPVREYLRKREDTVRCIVGNLIDNNSALMEDIEPNSGEIIGEDALEDDFEISNEAGLQSLRDWTPDPVESLYTKNYKCGGRKSDILSMLVNIYGSKERFVTEYRTLLADRLLSDPNVETEKEIRNLELIKLRFGESNLHHCDVMLKDITDSRRLNGTLRKNQQSLSLGRHEQTKVEGPKWEDVFFVTVLSRLFWPTFRDENIVVPRKIQSMMTNYEKTFALNKPSRTLEWKSHLGTVDLDLHFDSNTVSLTVSPFLACVILAFEDKDTWKIEELSRELGVVPNSLKKKMGFWLNSGVIKEVKAGIYKLVDCSEEKGFKDKDFQASSQMNHAGDNEQSALVSKVEAESEEMNVYWSFIVGMLTNLDTLPLDRIHMMLEMFVQDRVICTKEQLKSYLDQMVSEDKLISTGGMYSLPG
eukprot:Nk52_evm16s2241 gene=Nk52_evmTU16s2241